MASGFNMDFLSLLQNAFAGQFSPRQEDGLARLAVGNRGTGGLSGVDLVRYWSSLDANTPDKMNHQRAREIAGMYPGSQFASWMQPFMGKGWRPAAMYQAAVGQGRRGGGLGSMSDNQFTQFMGGLYGR